MEKVFVFFFVENWRLGNEVAEQGSQVAGQGSQSSYL